MRFNVLGPIEVESGTRRLRLSSPIQRTLLALLLVNRNREVSADRIVEAVWRDDGWRDGRRRLWVHVSKLRKFLEEAGSNGEQEIVTGTIGYRLQVDSHDLDSAEFERVVALGTSLGDTDPAAASDTLSKALELWRGDPYEDVPADAIGLAEPVRLNELRLEAIEARFEALLREGRHRSIIPELENAVAIHPFRESLRAQLMRALYGTGRQADALRVYQETRDVLASELGIDPSPALQDLELEILQQDRRLRLRTPTVLREGTMAEPAGDEKIVGREEPLAMLDNALQLAAAGTAQSVFVSGEAGMGKTGLLREFARRASSGRADLIILEARASPRTGVGTPFGVVRDALEQLIAGNGAGHTSFGPPPSAAARGAAINAVLQAGTDLVGALIPRDHLLAAAKTVNGSASESAVRSLESVRGGTAPLSRPLAKQCSDTIRLLASDATVLVLVDDVQWIDSPSLDVLSSLCELDLKTSILVVGAFRPEGFDTPHHSREILEFVRGGKLIDLDAVPADRARSLVDALIDRDPNRFVESFRDELTRRSGGNPLFALELLNGLYDQGSVVIDNGVWKAAPGWTWGGPPVRIESVLAHRFDRLDADLLTTLKVGSVEGIEFSADLVAATLGLPTSLTVERLSGEASGRHRLVEAVGPLQIGQNRVLRYRFRHQLFQEYAYGLLDDVERPDIHARVGTALESLTPEAAEEPWLGELARHFELAAMPAKAISYLYDAAAQAIRLGANVEAERAINRALGLLGELPPTDERDDTELDLQVLLGLALSMSRGFSATAVEHAYRRATDLMLATDDDVSRMPVHFGLWTYYASRSQFDRAHQLSTRMFDLATESGDDGLWLQALHTRWSESLFRGDLEAAVAAVEEARRTYRYEDHHPLSFRYGNHDPGVCALALGGLTRALGGQPDHAAQMMSQAEALAEVLNHPVSRAQARFLTSWVRQVAGDSAAALETAQRALAELADVKAPVFEGVARGVLAWALSQEGRESEAISAAEEATDPGRSMASDDVFAPMIGCLATHVYLEAGLTDRATALSSDLESLMRSVTEHFYAAEVLRTRARVLNATGQRAQAISLAEEALDLAEEQQARALSINAAATLATITDNRALAVGRLRSALGPLIGREDVPYVRDAMKLLEVT